MSREELFEQIPGSVKFHGASLGSKEPTAIMVCYNDDEQRGDILVSVDDKIYRKNEGANEFIQLIGGLDSSGIRFSINLNNKQYIPHSEKGLYEYDGISSITKINDVKLKDLIYSNISQLTQWIRSIFLTDILLQHCLVVESIDRLFVHILKYSLRSRFRIVLLVKRLLIKMLKRK
jgi:hypothetical protein